MNLDAKIPLRVKDVEVFLKRPEVVKALARDREAYWWATSISTFLAKNFGRDLDPQRQIPAELARAFRDLMKRVENGPPPKPTLVYSNEFWQLPSGAIEKPRPKLTLVTKK